MRSVRTVLVSLITLVAAILAGPLALMGTAGAQTNFSCPEGYSPNYYPCVALTGADRNCPDIGFSVNVVGGDPFGLDSDNDGIGCDAEYGTPEAIPAPTAVVDPTAVPTPVVDPTAVATPVVDPTAPVPTPTLSGLMPTVDGQCKSLEFATSDLAPVTIVTPGGNVTSFTNDAGQWTVDANNNLQFTPAVNASFPAGVNLNGMTNGNTVNITAIAECLSGRLAQTGTTAPTQAPTGPTPAPTTPVTDPTAAPTRPITDPTPPALAYTGSSTAPLAFAGVLMLVVGLVAVKVSNRSRG